MAQIWHKGILGLDFTTLDECDIEAVLTMRNDERVSKFMYSKHITHEAHRNFIANLRHNAASKYWLFKSDQILLGVGSLNRISLANKHAYIGIYANPLLTQQERQHIKENFASSEKSNGIGSMILDALESFAKCDLALHILYLEVLGVNERALRFYERNGYVYCGILQDYIYRSDVRAEGTFYDVRIYAKQLATKESNKTTQNNPNEIATNTPQILVTLDSKAMQKQPLESIDSTKKPKDFTTPPLIVAELSANHNHSLNLAKRTIRAAKLAGADFIKLQTYTPECLTLDSRARYFRIDSGTLWDGQTLYELYKQAYTPFEWHSDLFAYARAQNLGIFSSPFSPKALELLENLDCPMYKIASFEITDTPFIELVASTKKPIIISTGIAGETEILDALEACNKAGNNDITLLLCTSSYPAPLELANIASMPKLARYGVKYGLSDHTQGDLCALLATSLGASMIEKHFILKRTLGGVDSAFSMEAREFAQMTQRIHNACKALGSPHQIPDEALRKKQARFARSLFVCENIAQGETLTKHNIRSIRPNDGLPPKLLPQILGKRASRPLRKGEPLRLGDFL